MSEKTVQLNEEVIKELLRGSIEEMLNKLLTEYSYQGTKLHTD